MTCNLNKTFFWLLYSCNTIFGAARKYLLVDHVLVIYIYMQYPSWIIKGSQPQKCTLGMALYIFILFTE